MSNYNTKLNGETYTEKNYSGIEPVVTIIWMVDDILGFKEDFLKFKDSKEMEEVINRLRKDKLTSEEFKYVSDINSYEIFMVRKEEEYKVKLARQLARQKKQLEKVAFEYQLKLMEAEQEKQKAEQETQKAELLLIKLAKILLKQGEAMPSIAESLEISLEEATELIERIIKQKL